MRFHMSLRIRFMLSVTSLLIILAALTLFVIELREKKAIFNEQETKGVILAKYIAQVNSNEVLFWDEEEIKLSIDNLINDEVIYIIFYLPNKEPFVATDLIKNYDEIYRASLLEGEVNEQSFFFDRKELKDMESEKSLSILEVEVPVFVKRSPQSWGSVKIGLSQEEVEAEIQDTRMKLSLIVFAGLVIGILGAAWLSRRITEPLNKLVEATVKISKGELSQEIDIGSRDEIGNLAQSFNEMSRQLLLARKRMEEANIKLIQAEKLASIGRISAGIAHEIRNPLTSVKLNVQKLVQSDRLNQAEKEHISLSQEGIGQMEKFIKELLDFTRVSELNLNRFSIKQILEESVKMIADFLALKKIVLEKKFQEGLPQVLVDGDRLRQLFLNILRNAAEALGEEGKIKISLSLLEKQPVNKIKIEIIDNGCGIPEKDRDIIFEPFYTTKSSGIGLGLPNARKIVEQHKGSIRVKDCQGKGASFEILIPCEEVK